MPLRVCSLASALVQPQGETAVAVCVPLAGVRAVSVAGVGVAAVSVALPADADIKIP